MGNGNLNRRRNFSAKRKCWIEKDFLQGRRQFMASLPVWRRGGRPDSVNSAFVLRCGGFFRSIATDFFREKTYSFQNHSIRLERTKSEMKIAVGLRAFAELVGAFEGKWPETDVRNIGEPCPSFQL